MPPTQTGQLLAAPVPTPIVVGNPPRVENIGERDDGFLSDSAARIPFIVGMVVLGLILLGVLIWLICIFFIGGAAISRRHRGRARFYAGPGGPPTTVSLPTLPPASKPAPSREKRTFASGAYAAPAGLPSDLGSIVTITCTVAFITGMQHVALSWAAQTMTTSD
ncbi:hypothetical protein AURDEDRAFT_161568 [Auricularia subglabra TFB-10046 SS5]|nr:hypothetical protein AURDEDRAFT_161568 [Auricularia subglabra TFB-10046 SS5]